MLNHAASKEEIQSRVRRGYIERLDSRLKRMRRLLSDREWNLLRVECMHLKNTAPSFGLPIIAELAAVTEASIPAHVATSAMHLPQARETAEKLFSQIEALIAKTTGPLSN